MDKGTYTVKRQTKSYVTFHETMMPFGCLWTMPKSKKIQNLELEPWIKGSKVPAHLAVEPSGSTDPKIWKSKYSRPELHVSP
jgi:hypothetical protein